jgi:hypothetical protein
MAMGKDETMRSRDKAMLDKAVLRGVQYLDENPDREEAFIGWHEAINVNYLAMANGYNCIIGQLMGDYNRIREIDDFDSKFTERQRDRWAARHGFFVIDRDKRVPSYWTPGVWSHATDLAWRDEAYGYLTEQWRTVVMGRQLVRSLSDSLTEAPTAISTDTLAES